MANNNDNHTEVMVLLARIEEKQKDTHNDVAEIKRDVKQQNGRVRRLEIKSAYLWGGLGVAGIIVPLIMKYVI